MWCPPEDGARVLTLTGYPASLQSLLLLPTNILFPPSCPLLTEVRFLMSRQIVASWVESLATILARQCLAFMNGLDVSLQVSLHLERL